MRTLSRSPKLAEEEYTPASGASPPRPPPAPTNKRIQRDEHAFDPRKSHYPAKSTKTQHFSERDDEMSPKRLAVSLARSPKSHLGTRTTPLIALLSHSSPFPHSFLFYFVL
ncbi:hypothetical protein HYPSUDRAFT_203342 [Hypholoma sublateritium FD-334 SS-4]|uniref:Uncharacterized protein n=1 Tax=Hypholoma sublateritium (strain FD-334 SS-4) TaxID=945553 RepID=A0A0D2NQA8_HYPSF|nr:hypothetical protein HYPSUDRAFT_203342 [Hypholoma sublateritium FD-334 SS-4]